MYPIAAVSPEVFYDSTTSLGLYVSIAGLRTGVSRELQCGGSHDVTDGARRWPPAASCTFPYHHDQSNLHAPWRIFRWGVSINSIPSGHQTHIPARRLETSVASRVTFCLFLRRHLCNSVEGGCHWGRMRNACSVVHRLMSRTTRWNVLVLGRSTQQVGWIHC
jgi:hypothetical protein